MAIKAKKKKGNYILRHPIKSLKKLGAYVLLGYGIYTFGGAAIDQVKLPESRKNFGNYAKNVIKRADDPLVLYGEIANEASQFKEGYLVNMNKTDYKKVQSEVVSGLESLRDHTRNKADKQKYQEQIDELNEISPSEANKFLRIFESIGKGYENAKEKP